MAKAKYTDSGYGKAKKIIDDMPAAAQAAMNLVNKFDPQKYQEVIDFATAANGGRPILGVTKAPAATE